MACGKGHLMQKNKPAHLPAHDRNVIALMVTSECPTRAIASALGKSPSTVSREIRNHTQTIPHKNCDCIYFKECRVRHACGSASCSRLCKTCQHARKKCTDYIKSECEQLNANRHHLCNSCLDQKRCYFEKRIYSAEKAQQEYENTRSQSRQGYNLTGEELEKINDIVSPAIKQGLSVYHIKQAYGAVLPVSESTIRRLVNSCELDARNIDLRDQVKRRPRRKPHKMNEADVPVSKAGHLYKDYLRYIDENDVPVVQMDCVEGKKEDSSVLLTLHFEEFSLQLAVILEGHTAACVVYALDKIEQAIGTDMFREAFPVILTDNGHEFADIDGMERSVSGGKRTQVFFCEPNRSDEKAECENNHKLIRYVIPKGTSLDQYMQADITLMMNHVNSYCRKKLHGKCPYDVAMNVLPEDFFGFLGLEKVPPEEVNLTPELLIRLSPPE